MSWLPSSSQTVTSEPLTVLLRDWNSYVISLHKTVSNNQVASDQLKVLNNIVENLDIPNMDPIDFISIEEERVSSFSSMINMIYKFHWHSIIDIIGNNSRPKFLDNWPHSVDNSNVSLIHHVAKCPDDKELMKNVGYIHWPYSAVGPVEPIVIPRCLNSDASIISRFCFGDYSSGAYLEPFNASISCKAIYERCPPGYHSIISDYCTLITKPDSWSKSLQKAYVTGQEFSICSKFGVNSSNYMSLIKYVPKGISKIWLPIRRIRKYGQFVSIENNKEKRNCNLTKSFWAPGHPIFDKDCVAKSLHDGYLHTISCTSSLPFVSNIDVEDFLVEDIQERKQTDPSCPKGGFSPVANLDHKVCIIRMAENSSSWIDAERICKSNGYHLPQPGRLFMNWVYRNLLNEKGGILFINASTVKNTQDYHFWSPGEKQNSSYAIMSREGWIHQVNSLEPIPIFCEKHQAIHISSDLALKLHFINDSSYICIDMSSAPSLKYDSLICQLNGQTVKIDDLDDPLCVSKKVLNIGPRTGYFSCSGWTNNPHHYVKSNELHKRSLGSLIYIFKVWKNTSYDPFFHDSNNKRNESENACNQNLFNFLISQGNISCKHNFFAPSEQSIGLNEYSEVSVDITDGAFLRLRQLINTSLVDRSLIVDVMQATGCPESVFIEKNSQRSLSFPETSNSGQFMPTELCVTENGLPVTRTCFGDYFEGYRWSDNVSGKCFSSSLSHITRLLYNETQQLNSTTLMNLRNYTSDTTKLKPIDIVLISKILYSIKENSSTNNNIPVTYFYEDLLSVMDNILAVGESSFESVQMSLNTSNKLLSSFQNLVFKLPSKNLENVHFSNKKILAERIDLSSNQDVIGISASNILGQKSSSQAIRDEKEILQDNISVAAILPKQDDSLKNHRNTTVNFVIFKSSKLFIEPETASSSRKINSDIFEISYQSTEVKNLTHPVRIFFTPINPELNSFCAFWDFTKYRERGGWSTIGCEKNTTTNLTNGLIACECYHLTSFSLIVNYDGEEVPEIHGYILEYISLIGCSLSSLGLFLILLTFILFNEWRRKLLHKVHFNLSLAILCTMVIFIIGISQNKKVWLCRSVAIGLHYFFSASFSWMMVEGFLLYLKIVRLKREPISKFMRIALVFGWGVPVIPIVAMLSHNITLYDGGIIDHKESEICWISSKGFKYGFLPLLVLTLVINFVFHFAILYKLKFDKLMIASTASEKDIQKMQIKTAILTFFLLGFTWTFGLLAVSGARTVFSYLFCTFNSIQGFVLFCFFVVNDKDARKHWLDVFSSVTGNLGSSPFGHSTESSNDFNHKKLETETLSSYGSNERKKKKIRMKSPKNSETMAVSSI